MRWEVTGADRLTGVDREIFIEADDQYAAGEAARGQGLIIESVKASPSLAIPLAPAAASPSRIPRVIGVAARAWGIVGIVVICGAALTMTAAQVNKQREASEKQREQRWDKLMARKAALEEAEQSGRIHGDAEVELRIIREELARAGVKPLLSRQR